MADAHSTFTRREMAAGTLLFSLAADADALRRALMDCIDQPPAQQARALMAAAALAGRVGLTADRAAHSLGRARCQSDDDWLFDGDGRDAMNALTVGHSLTGAHGG